MIQYGTGLNGFIGSHLKNKLPGVIHIPHEKISTYPLDDFSDFFFCSSYGNLIDQTDDRDIYKANITDLIDLLADINWDSPDIKSFVYLSTSSVSRKRQTMYSRSKQAAEEILLGFMEKYNAPICIIRPFSVTGVGEQSQHLIPTLIRSCYTGEEVPFVASPKHDFIDVDDVVDGIVNLSQNQAKGIFELGTGKDWANWEVLALVEKITGKKANIKPVRQLRDYDSESWVSTNMRSRNFGWEPKKSLEDSIKEMVEAYNFTK